MNVKGNGYVSKICLTHKGCQKNLVCMVPVVHRETLAEGTATILTFQDTNEIESLICMLTEFKKDCIYGMGKWKEKKE